MIPKGFRHSEESKQKMRDASVGRLGRPHTDESKEKIRQAMRGRVESLDTRMKKSAALKGRVIGDSQRKAVGDAHRTHGMTNTNEYRTWVRIRQRCYNQRLSIYKDYGGRGITVCERWRNSFDLFYADMGQRPSGKSSIQRIDNDGPYAPDNCKWSEPKEQASNRRRAIRVVFEGRVMGLKEVSALTGISYQTLFWRHTRSKPLLS